MMKATYEDIHDIQEEMVELWGEAGKEVVVACFYENPFNDTFNEFLKHCTACGGNWGGMLLTGIRKLYPKVWEKIPEDMGIYAWSLICNVLLLLGVYVKEPKDDE